MTLLCHAGHGICFEGLAVASAVLQLTPHQPWASDTSKFLWRGTPTEKTCLILVGQRDSRGRKGLISVANEVFPSGCLTLRIFRTFPQILLSFFNLPMRSSVAGRVEQVCVFCSAYGGDCWCLVAVKSRCPAPGGFFSLARDIRPSSWPCSFFLLFFFCLLACCM